ncbi:transcriptional regulator [Streptomyces sp. CB02923]|uniref:helix-turn-helix domain-containing protein n=1 Tax=Streptomyces sp. CB02923 TaxID=1718985 RepID=UPI00093994E3|nr:helix-turn-helix transcriptional regulator [Streptomyces sp. CB02923]OKI09953.1 transcriptional regulator [Streptomyces sp. CB02923]
MAWRYCGNQLKLWRTRAGVTREELAEEANYDVEYVKSMEQGRRRPTLRVLQVADPMCGAHGLLEAAHDFLQPEKRPRHTDEYMDLERTAIGLDWYEPLYIPGLLQTEEYVCELMTHGPPPLSDELVEERIGFRLKRQEVLGDRPGTVFNFVIYEAALRTMVGGAEVMKRQLERLLEVQRMRNVCVQILPVDRAPYTALAGPIVLLETAEHETLAYLPGQGVSVLQSDPSEVSCQRRAYGMMRMQALGVEDSDERIRQVAKEL